MGGCTGCTGMDPGHGSLVRTTGYPIPSTRYPVPSTRYPVKEVPSWHMHMWNAFATHLQTQIVMPLRMLISSTREVILPVWMRKVLLLMYTREVILVIRTREVMLFIRTCEVILPHWVARQPHRKGLGPNGVTPGRRRRTGKTHAAALSHTPGRTLWDAEFLRLGKTLWRAFPPR